MTYLLDTNAISDLMRASQRVEDWMARLDANDRIVTCAVVRGEILFGIARLPRGKRRKELEVIGPQFLEAFHCEPIPERAGDVYAALKTERQRRGLALDENDLWVAATAVALSAVLVSRDSDFDGIDGLSVVKLG
ncbi:MAG: type II toxin-antitoxin system VapC family toxin [Bryobacteraceae bacterium]